MRKAIIALTLAAILGRIQEGETDPFRVATLRTSTSNAGCKWMSNGDREMLMSFARWLASDSSASRLRSEAGVASSSPDSVSLVTSPALCDSLNALVVSRLSTFGKTLPSTWKGVVAAKLRSGLYLVDPIDGEQSNRWYFIVRPDLNAVYFYSTGW